MGERNRCMGASAKNQLMSNIKNTIWGWKKLIGHQFAERVVQNDIPHLTYEVIEGQDGGIGIRVCVVGVYLNCSLSFKRTKHGTFCGGHDQGHETTAVWNEGQSASEVRLAGDGG